MRGYLAHWLDLIAHGADGRGPVHLLLLLRRLGLLGTGERRVGFVLPFSLSGCFRGLFNISRALFLRPANSKLVLSWRTGKGFRVRIFWMPEDLYNYLFPPAGKI